MNVIDLLGTVMRLLNPHGDSAVVLEALRSWGDVLQERAPMLLPKPGPAAGLSDDELAAMTPTLIGRCCLFLGPVLQQ